MRWIAVLDTMWGNRAGQAPSYFCISSDNFSGRRLYELTGEEEECQWVTNCCPEIVTHASRHGVSSVPWLEANLTKWLGIMSRKAERWRGVHTPGILVCGNVAQNTYDQLSSKPQFRTIYLPHPAARNWTKKAAWKAARFIQEGQANLRMQLVDDGLSVRCL